MRDSNLGSRFFFVKDNVKPKVNIAVRWRNKLLYAVRFSLVDRITDVCILITNRFTVLPARSVLNTINTVNTLSIYTNDNIATVDVITNNSYPIRSNVNRWLIYGNLFVVRPSRFLNYCLDETSKHKNVSSFDLETVGLTKRYDVLEN